MRALASETLGLLGRAAKQRFVAAVDEDRGVAAHHLRAAIGHYSSAYQYDPAWHGANLVALAWRAKKEGITVAGADTERVAKELLEDLGDAAGWAAWDQAAAGQALMALERWQEALKTYGRYVEETNYPFVLGGDLRQLRQIWCLEAGGESPGSGKSNKYSSYGPFRLSSKGPELPRARRRSATWVLTS